jgi:hypothetical protein
VGTAASAVPPEPALSERSESKGRNWRNEASLSIKQLNSRSVFSVPIEPYFFSASAAIFSITIAVDPPRAYALPLAVTLCPAKGSSFSF